MASFDVDSIQGTIEKVLKAKDEGLEAARQLYEETLVAWTDDFSRILEAPDDSTAETRKPYEDAIVRLWIEYANFEKRLRQWKQAVKVYESAISDDVGEKAIRLWLEYGRFCRDRGKFVNAQKVYLRAVDVLPEAETDQIWRELGESLRERGIQNAESVEQIQALVGYHPLKSEGPLADPQDPQQSQGKEAEGPSASIKTEPEPPTPTEAISAIKPSSTGQAPADCQSPQGFMTDNVHESAKDEAGDMSISEDQQHTELVIRNTPEPAFQVDVAESSAPPSEQASTMFPPPLLFPTLQLTMEDAQGKGLEPAVIQQITNVLSDPTIFDILHGQRLIQIIKEQLAQQIVEQQEKAHLELKAVMQQRHAALQTAALQSPVSALLHSQREQEWQTLESKCQGERDVLMKQITSELWQLLESQQKLLGMGTGLGLPLVMVSRDLQQIQIQQKVVRAIQANLELYQFHKTKSALEEKMAEQLGMDGGIQTPEAQSVGGPKAFVTQPTPPGTGGPPARPMFRKGFRRPTSAQQQRQQASPIYPQQNDGSAVQGRSGEATPDQKRHLRAIMNLLGTHP